MSSSTKYWILKVVTLLSIPLMAICLSHMIGPGMSGHFAEARNWFIGAMLVTIVGCVTYVCSSYYKAKAGNESSQTSIDILNEAAHDIAETKAATDTSVAAPPIKPKQ